MRPLLIALGGPIKRAFNSKSSHSPSSSGVVKASHSAKSSRAAEYPNRRLDASDVRAGISTRMPVGEGPLFTNRVYGGTSSQWPFLTEEAAGAISVRSELEQSTAKL